MPELPEVETVVRGLRATLVGLTIKGVTVNWARSIALPSPDVFAASLPGERVLQVERRGKYVVMHLDHGKLLIHLRMTGRLQVVTPEEPLESRHLRVLIHLDGKLLLFYDARKFGRMYLLQETDQLLGRLGPEPLTSEFVPVRLAERLRGKRAIKSALLDQRVIAGLGNIYADEALFVAGVSPERPAGSLTHKEISALCAAIRAELQRGIAHGGTTLSDYRDAAGSEGRHRQHLRVYGRRGQPCPACGCDIACRRIAGRSSYHCPECQR
ncbi:MAG: bifunctional DNA-formamidopyrimidine glycosylase/DNA-(apurinic or apyrimidinic site) lyase [Anaerolineae bacterium]